MENNCICGAAWCLLLRVKNCSVLKVSSGVQPWPCAPEAATLITKLRTKVVSAGGKCKARFQDGSLWIAIRGLDKEWIGRLAADWRKAILARNETTVIEQLDGATLPKSKNGYTDYPDDVE